MKMFKPEPYLFEQVWENSFDAMRLVDTSGIMRYVNPSFCKMVELSKEELIGESLSIIYDKDQRQNIHDKFVCRFHDQRIKQSLERPLELWNGKKVWFEASNTVIDSHHHGLLLLSIFRDNTEKEKAVKEARRYAEELKAMNATKDKFFSLISHDLRGPFQSLLGLIELLSEELETITTEELREYVDSMHRTIHAQYDMLENLLSWSRLQIGKQSVSTDKIRIYDVADEVVRVMEPGVKRKQIKLHRNIYEELFVRADRNMLKSIVQNLLSNAIKFTPENGRIILEASGNENSVKIRVQDSGAGIDEEIKDKLFDISSNTRRRGTDGEKGSGLGLIIVGELVRLQNGSIEVSSEPDKGSTFTVTLPAG